MRSNSFEKQKKTEINQKKADKLRGFLIFWMITKGKEFQMEGKQCKVRERLEI